MKYKLIFLFFLILSEINNAQTPLESLALKCDLPDVHFIAFDSINCEKFNLAQNDIFIDYLEDTLNPRRHIYDFGTHQTKYILEASSGSTFTRIIVPPTYYFIYTDSLNRITEMICVDADSCLYKEVKTYYYNDGIWVTIYNCDYSRPNLCMEKAYFNGILRGKIDYIPIEQINPRPSQTDVNVNIEKKVVVKRSLTFDEFGNVLYDEKF